jgi:hypothetical protein
VTSGLVADAALALPAERDVARARFAPRLVPADWPATSASRQEALERLTRPPFVLGAAGSQKQRVTGLGLLLDWLGDDNDGFGASNRVRYFRPHTKPTLRPGI